MSQIPDFFDDQLSEERKQRIYQQAENYLKAKTYSALTFEMYQLQGTPSSILIDKKGILKRVSFAINNNLETDIQTLLDE